MADSVMEGGCLRGEIRYRVTEPPKKSMICHCRTCRMASAAPLVPWVVFSTDAFTFVQGQPAWFQSSASVTRTFCPSCGTPLTYQRADQRSHVEVTTCAVNDPDAFPPTHHSWTSHDLVWVQTAGELPTYGRTSGES